MFEQLKRAFSDVAKNISSHKIISEKDLNKGLSELELSLLESDVAPEVVDELSKSLRTELLGLELEKDQTSEQVIKLKLRHLIRDMFTKSGSMNLIQQIKIKKEAGYGPFVIVLLGINGTGKTTTIAKIARLLKKNGISVVLAAADTHRAGAIEQLSQHGENLSIKVISQRYGADPSAVGRDAVEYATKHRVDTVLIDTAGRMQTAKNLMDEINKIVRVVKPDIKLFIGDSLAGNDTINQSREFFEYTKFDGAILTKTDADVKGGSAISIVHTTSKPIVLLGMGQSYDDIVPFNSEKFLDSIFGDSPLISEKEIPAPVTTKIDQTDVYERSRQMAQKEIQPDLLREGQSMELSADSSDIKTSNVESLGEGNAEELSPQQAPEQQQQQQQQQAPEQQQQQQQQQAPEQQQQQMEQLKKTITTSPNINPREPNGKKESGGFFKTLFGRKSKNSGQDLERKHDVKENPEVDKKAEIELASSKEPEEYIDKKIKTDKKIKNQENDEVVYLSDEDIEDLLK